MCCDWLSRDDGNGLRDFGLKPQSIRGCIASAMNDAQKSLMDNLGLSLFVSQFLPENQIRLTVCPSLRAYIGNTNKRSLKSASHHYVACFCFTAYLVKRADCHLELQTYSIMVQITKKVLAWQWKKSAPMVLA
jgi:hypothetical protein